MPAPVFPAAVGQVQLSMSLPEGSPGTLRGAIDTGDRDRGREGDPERQGEMKGGSASSNLACPPWVWEEVTRSSLEAGDTRGQPRQGLGLCVKAGSTNATSSASVPDPGHSGAGAGAQARQGCQTPDGREQVVTFHATCSPQASC